MPTPEEELALGEEKFRQFFVLADEILALRQTINEHLETALRDGAFQNSLRNRVLVGLSIKAPDCFDRLLVDARERRAECSHHLKTMAECLFIRVGKQRHRGNQGKDLGGRRVSVTDCIPWGNRRSGTCAGLEGNAVEKY